MNTQARIKCGNCKRTHFSTAEVKACYYPPITKLCLDLKPHGQHTDESRNWTCPGVAAPATAEQSSLPAGSRGVTQRQLDYIKTLGGDPVLALNYTLKGASLYIDRLKREKRKTVTTDAPNRKETKIPLAMLHALPDGYYASRMDATRPYTFFRISRPKSGNFKDSLKIQTQHGPDLNLALVIYPGDRLYWTNMSVEENLLLVAVDPNGCAIAYAEEIGNCMRCNTELTDERSRWYGIGPECEKRWPHIIDLINDRKGEYRPGWEG